MKLIPRPAGSALFARLQAAGRTKIDHLFLYVCIMTLQEAAQQLLFQLFHIYEEREARNIAELVMENITGWKRIDRIMNKQVALSPGMENLLQRYTKELLDHKPLQYVIGEAWFYGMKFYVDEHVLIPRPETEELVEWLVTDMDKRSNQTKQHKILDIGTGSGCIAVALKRCAATADVSACDISTEALEVASRNALSNGTSVHFVACNFLDPAARNRLGKFDMLVSNPPYIPVKDQGTMQLNVLNYEPHPALFVENNDPLLFYHAIAEFSTSGLAEDGAIYVEIHELMGNQVAELFGQKGFAVSVKKDMEGKERMVKAMRNPAH
jgi:release factor glutamine methyltransferase